MNTIVRYFGIAAIAAATLQPALAAPASSSSIKQTLQGLYNKESVAAENKDVDAMMADYDPKVVAIMQNGEQKGYQDLLAADQQVVGMAKTIKDTTVVNSVDGDGSKVVAETHDNTILTIEEPTTKNDMVIAVTSTSHDTWVKSGDRWKIVKSVEIEHTATADGQPVPGI